VDIVAVERLNIGDQVFEQLKENLIAGTWRQGDKLPSETDLALNLGTSRVTVRQAISKLATLGLIETRVGEGSFVKELTTGERPEEQIPYDFISEERLNEVLEFRIIFEVGVVGLAAKVISDESIGKLERSLERMRAAVGDLNQYVREDLDFHTQIARSTENDLVIQLSTIIQDILKNAILEVSEKAGTENGPKYHGMIIEALKAHDENRAKLLMKDHLMKAYGKMI